jgi:hypothetical protein
VSPRKRKRKNVGCAIDVTPGGKLRFRFRSELPGVGLYRFGETTALKDTPENRRLLERHASLIGAEIRTGRFDYLKWFPDGSKTREFREAAEAKKRRIPSGEPVRKVAECFAGWLEWKKAERVR